MDWGISLALAKVVTLFVGVLVVAVRVYNFAEEVRINRAKKIAMEGRNWVVCNVSGSLIFNCVTVEVIHRLTWTKKATLRFDLFHHDVEVLKNLSKGNVIEFCFDDNPQHRAVDVELVQTGHYLRVV